MIEDHASQRLSCNCMIGFKELLSLMGPSSTIRFNQTVTSTEISCNSYVSDSQNISSPDVVIWSAFLRSHKKLKHILPHIGHLAYLYQRITWRPTIHLLTSNLDIPPRIIYDSKLLWSYYSHQGVGSSEALPTSEAM